MGGQYTYAIEILPKQGFFTYYPVCRESSFQLHSDITLLYFDQNLLCIFLSLRPGFWGYQMQKATILVEYNMMMNLY